VGGPFAAAAAAAAYYCGHIVALGLFKLLLLLLLAESEICEGDGGISSVR